MDKTQIEGIAKHADEVTKDWHKAYQKAVADDNADAIAMLLKVAPKLKRVHTMTYRIIEKADEYAQADKILAVKVEATGDMEQDLTLAAFRASSMRKVNSLHRFAQEVEKL